MVITFVVLTALRGVAKGERECVCVCAVKLLIWLPNYLADVAAALIVAQHCNKLTVISVIILLGSG